MFKTAARKIAHNTTMPGLPGLSAKQDLRSLQELITSEKAILNSYVDHRCGDMLRSQNEQAAEAERGLSTGVGGPEGVGVRRGRRPRGTHPFSSLCVHASHPIQDTLGMSTSLLLHWSTALATFAGHEQNVRDQMKSPITWSKHIDSSGRWKDLQR